MIRGLVAKSLRETWAITALFAAGFASVMSLITYVLPQVQQGLDGILASLPFVRTIITALLGTDVGEAITGQMMQAMLWVHPVVLSLLWGYEIVICTRFPAGEIDRGTVDLLLGLPVSRRGVLVAESIAWMIGGCSILLAGFIGHLLVVKFALPVESRPDLARSLLVMVNLYGVYLAVGGVSFLVSACCDRRGTAMAIVFGYLLASFLLNFLAQFWNPAKACAFLSLMHYYQPARIFQQGLSNSHLVTLFAVAGITWGMAGEVVARRDIRTV